MKNPTLYEVYPEFETNGIFTHLSELSMPWTDDPSTLNIAYYTHSGNKRASPLLLHYYPLSETDSQRVANVVNALYGKSWTKLYNTMSLEYNPISNYDMTEEEATESSGKVSTDTGNESDVYGFNSELPTGDTENAEHSDGKSESKINRKLTRSGNIGITTSQQMIESERALWLWRFFEQVFKDLDTVLTCPLYESEV